MAYSEKERADKITRYFSIGLAVAFVLLVIYVCVKYQAVGVWQLLVAVGVIAIIAIVLTQIGKRTDDQTSDETAEEIAEHVEEEQEKTVKSNKTITLAVLLAIFILIVCFNLFLSPMARFKSAMKDGNFDSARTIYSSFSDSQKKDAENWATVEFGAMYGEYYMSRVKY